MLPLPSSGQSHYTVAFSPDGRWLAAGGSEHAIDVWDLHAPHSAARRFAALDGPILRARFAPNDRLVVVSTSGSGCFNVPTGAFLYRRRGIADSRRADVADDGESVFLFRGAFERWPVLVVGFLTPVWSRTELDVAFLTDLAATADERVIAAANRPSAPNGSLEVRSATDGHRIDAVPINCRPHRVACSADGTLAAVLAHGHLSVWNLSARTPVVERSAATHGGWLSVAFDPHGRRIVTGGIDSTVAVWDASSARPPLTTFQWGVGPVYAVAFDRDGCRASAAGHSGAIVWDVDE
jgi:WD40 repeat protein